MFISIMSRFFVKLTHIILVYDSVNFLSYILENEIIPCYMKINLMY